VVDSVAALVPQAEIEGDMGDATRGQQARLMSQAMRKMAGAFKASNTALVFTNQLWIKFGVLFGNPEMTTGGMALKIYSSVRLDLRQIERFRSDGEVIGCRVRARVNKSKVALPFKLAAFDIMYDQGISREGEVLDLGVGRDVNLAVPWAEEPLWEDLADPGRYRDAKYEILKAVAWNAGLADVPYRAPYGARTLRYILLGNDYAATRYQADLERKKARRRLILASEHFGVLEGLSGGSDVIQDLLDGLHYEGYVEEVK